MHERASILVGLLWCVAVVAVVVVGALYTAQLDLRVVKNHGDQIQAHYLALAGIEQAKALLYHDALERRRRGENHTGELFDAPHHFRDVPLGRGEFRVFRQGTPEEGGGIIYGIRDEESRLNLNHAPNEELENLPGITPEAVGSITGYRQKVNPFRTTRELLGLPGISRELFLGEDTNQNELLDPEEDDGDLSYPPDNRDGVLDAGWSGVLTVHSAVRNVNARGVGRVNIQSADEQELSAIEGISSELAKAIVEYRNQNQLERLADLLDVESVTRGNQPPPQPASSQTPSRPASRAAPSFTPGAQPSVPTQPPPRARSPQRGAGQKLISEELFLEIADELTADAEIEQPGAVNLNTAGASVLACLPGLDHHLAQAILSYRQSSGYFPNIAWLLKVPGMDRERFQQAAPRVSARSETFRITSEGRVPSTGARKRLQVIVRLAPRDIETLHYREDL